MSTETDRVETFTDRVLAVILAIMVFQLRVPQGTEPRSLLPTLPAIATFALSFILIGIYWNNYHHMLRASRGVDGRARGANLHLLFWLSLVPFARRSHRRGGPVAFPIGPSSHLSDLKTNRDEIRHRVDSLPRARAH